MHSTVSLASAMAMPAAATTMLLWTHFPWNTTEAVEESVMTVSIIQQGDTVSRARITFTDLLVLILLPRMLASSVTVTGPGLEMAASTVTRLEANVIVRDVCLADSAFSARMDSMTCRR